jgi:hypothetical protein
MKETSGRIIIYYWQAPEKDRFIFGDRWIRPLIRKLLRGKKIGGIEKVFHQPKKEF